MSLDHIDTTILSELTVNARASQVELAERVGMSSSDDYIVIVMARDIEDFERIHRTELSRLPRVARIQSSFAMREVVNRAVPPVIFAGSRRPRSAQAAR